MKLLKLIETTKLHMLKKYLAVQNAVSTSDREFITQAAQANLTEIQLGQLAQNKGATSAVQQYGQRMVQEHTQANSQLQQLAEQKNLTLPQDIGKQNKRESPTAPVVSTF